MEETRPLEGLKVIDFGWVVAVPTATKCLGAYGATVIGVESKNRLGLYRSYAPYAGGIRSVNRGYAFAWYNSNKRGVTLNLKHPKGVETFKKLVKWADVVIENFTAGTMDNWKLGYDELKKINPKLIMLQASIQGQKGPHAMQSGLGTMMQAAGGFTNMVGWPDRAPVQPSVPIPDFIGAWYMVTLILSALDCRNRTGQGTYIDLSQLEGGVSNLAPAILDYAANKENMGRLGNRAISTAPHGIFRCKGDDRWCAITVSQDSEWAALCQAINRPWTKDAKFTTALGRKQNEDELEKLIGQWTAGFPPEEVMTILQKNGVPAGVVQNAHDLVKDQQLNHRKHFKNVEHPEMGTYVNADFSFRMSEAPSQFTASPCLGEHNQYVYQEILGMSDEEFIELTQDGAFD